MRDSAQVDTNLVPQNVVFENPTISALSSFASRFVEQARSGSLTAESVAVKDEDKIRSMLDMVSKYTTEFPTHPSTGGHTLAETGPSVVLVTGTTGGLGTRLLADLHASPDVVKIYAVNRKQHTSLEVKQKESLVKQGLDPGVVDSDKVVLVEADLSKENAGLAPEVLEEVRLNRPRCRAWTQAFVYVGTLVCDAHHTQWLVSFVSLSEKWSRL